MNRFIVVIAVILLWESTACAERWTLVDFGHNLASTQTPYPDWAKCCGIPPEPSL